MKNNDVLFCRKAVVNCQSDTTAYHLLHPDNTTNTSDGSFLSTLFIDVNLAEITQQKVVFIQSSLGALDSIPLPAEFPLVIFLHSNELSEEDNIEELSKFVLDGNQLGIINPDPASYSADFLTLFSYALFNLGDLDIDAIIKRGEHPLLSQKSLWVNQIDHSYQFSRLKEKMKTGWFSGDFIKKKMPVTGKRILSYKAILIDVLNIVNNKNASFHEVAECIKRDPLLTFRIIKLTHIKQHIRQFTIPDVYRAVEIIGFKDLTQWVSLAMLGSITGKPACLFSMAVSRACFCQSVSAALFPKVEGAFLMGIFSYLPSFFDEELTELLKELPINANIQSALLEHKGSLGGVLKLIEAFEAGHWELIPFDSLANKNISKENLKDLYIESLKTARAMTAL
ncbi:EAL and HDOD domain-containing protein [Marinomonas transparens]|uniref:HDOD domain-containing protein n=1 Tax=Marinomonas transparens TaxID=2795388 RepID=A0A934MWI7_9GAMM|nr:HDOD domain-containing protein [Marinomonas transparens]MBJ7538209.1 HDOD domain-containing protein [Marinomonas transparens]